MFININNRVTLPDSSIQLFLLNYVVARQTTMLTIEGVDIFFSGGNSTATITPTELKNIKINCNNLVGNYWYVHNVPSSPAPYNTFKYQVFSSTFFANRLSFKKVIKVPGNFKKNFFSIFSSTQTTVEPSNFSKGKYIVVFKDNTKKLTTQFLKQ